MYKKYNAKHMNKEKRFQATNWTIITKIKKKKLRQKESPSLLPAGSHSRWSKGITNPLDYS
jgi:hypothetical protein